MAPATLTHLGLPMYSVRVPLLFPLVLPTQLCNPALRPTDLVRFYVDSNLETMEGNLLRFSELSTTDCGTRQETRISSGMKVRVVV